MVGINDMEVLTGLQPNCSELVIRLGDVDKSYVFEELSKLGIEQYVIRDKYSRYTEKLSEWDGDKNIQRHQKLSEFPADVIIAWDKLYEDSEDNPEYKEILKKHDLELFRDTLSLSDGESLAADWDPGLTVGGDPYDDGTAIWYSPSTNPQGYPLLKRISDHFGMDVEAHDGGTRSVYKEWLEENGHAERNSNEYVGESDSYEDVR